MHSLTNTIFRRVLYYQKPTHPFSESVSWLWGHQQNFWSRLQPPCWTASQTLQRKEFPESVPGGAHRDAAPGTDSGIRLHSICRAGLSWTHLESIGLTWTHLDSLGLTWAQLAPLGFTWFYLGSLGFTWSHLVLLGFAWFLLVSLGFTWLSLVSLGFAWFHLVPRVFT